MILTPSENSNFKPCQEPNGSHNCSETHKGWRGTGIERGNGKQRGEGGDREFYFSIASFFFFFKSRLLAFVFLTSIIYNNVDKSTKNWEKTEQLQNQIFKQYILRQNTEEKNNKAATSLSCGSTFESFHEECFTDDLSVPEQKN